RGGPAHRGPEPAGRGAPRACGEAPRLRHADQADARRARPGGRRSQARACGDGAAAPGAAQPTGELAEPARWDRTPSGPRAYEAINMATIPSDPIPGPLSAHQVETRTKSPREGRAGGRPHERLTEDRAGRLPPKALMAVEWLCAILNPVPRLVVDLQVQSAAAHLSWAAVRRAERQPGIGARAPAGRRGGEGPGLSARPAVE